MMIIIIMMLSTESFVRARLNEVVNTRWNCHIVLRYGLRKILQWMHWGRWGRMNSDFHLPFRFRAVPGRHTHFARDHL